MAIQIIAVSSSFGESDDLSVLSEAFSAEEKVVLADQTDLASASSDPSAELPLTVGLSFLSSSNTE